MAECVIFRPCRLSAPCACGEWPAQPHVVNAAVYCSEHCPVCRPVVKFAEKIELIRGEQENLFS